MTTQVIVHNRICLHLASGPEHGAFLVGAVTHYQKADVQRVHVVVDVRYLAADEIMTPAKSWR